MQHDTFYTLHETLNKGHVLPPPLRAHVWHEGLGGDILAQRIGSPKLYTSNLNPKP
jgi:hypothetical protein